jgi:hypothetical protein
MESPAWFTDTDPRLLEVWLERLRRLTEAEKFLMVFDLTDMATRFAEAGVRARYPYASDREVFLRYAALRLDRETMIRAYGWDPEAH